MRFCPSTLSLCCDAVIGLRSAFCIYPYLQVKKLADEMAEQNHLMMSMPECVIRVHLITGSIFRKETTCLPGSCNQSWNWWRNNGRHVPDVEVCQTPWTEVGTLLRMHLFLQRGNMVSIWYQDITNLCFFLRARLSWRKSHPALGFTGKAGRTCNLCRVWLQWGLSREVRCVEGPHVPTDGNCANCMTIAIWLQHFKNHPSRVQRRVQILWPQKSWCSFRNMPGQRKTLRKTSSAAGRAT